MEMREQVEKAYEQAKVCGMEFCPNCPCRQYCQQNENFHYGCSAWEDEMGEDL
jgi:hypothetical protein